MVAPRGGSKKQKAILMGVGLDNKDGHTRVTKGDNFVMMGGSEETHERMTETAIKVNEKLSENSTRPVARSICGRRASTVRLFAVN